MSSPFAGTHFVDGLGWVEGGKGAGATGALHGEADVMMISGIGHATESSQNAATVSTRSDTGQVVATGGAFSLKAALTQKVSIFGIALPAYIWALIALGALGAGWVFFKKMKKG